jgi:hypothetical protein
MVEKPPTSVGTGFTNFFPSRLAGVMGMKIRWNRLAGDSPIDLTSAPGETEGIRETEQICRLNSWN